MSVKVKMIMKERMITNVRLITKVRMLFREITNAIRSSLLDNTADSCNNYIRNSPIPDYLIIQYIIVVYHKYV